MFSIGDREVIKPASILLQEILITSQGRPCKRAVNLKTLMGMAACATKEWSGLLLMMKKAAHLKNTALSMEMDKKLNIRNRLKSLTISKSSKFSNLSQGLMISTTVSTMETLML